jgi:hypothetical protein
LRSDLVIRLTHEAQVIPATGKRIVSIVGEISVTS